MEHLFSNSTELSYEYTHGVQYYLPAIATHYIANDSFVLFFGPPLRACPHFVSLSRVRLSAKISPPPPLTNLPPMSNPLLPSTAQEAAASHESASDKESAVAQEAWTKYVGGCGHPQPAPLSFTPFFSAMKDNAATVSLYAMGDDVGRPFLLRHGGHDTECPFHRSCYDTSHLVSRKKIMLKKKEKI